MKASNPSLGEFTPTGLVTYLECPRKFYFQKIMKLMPKIEHNAASFGTAIHEGVAAYYKNQKLPLLDRKRLAIQAFATKWKPEYDNEKRNLGIGLVLLGKYCDYYSADNFQYMPEMIESMLQIAMPNGTFLTLKIDRVFVMGQVRIVVDTKTTTMTLTDWFWKEYEMSFQLAGYHYAIEQVCGVCDNVQVDAIWVNPKPEFVRRTLQKTEKEIQEWLNTYERITSTITKSLLSNDEIKCFYQNTCSCAKYGGCAYISVCKYGYDHPDVELMFTRKEVEEV